MFQPLERMLNTTLESNVRIPNFWRVRGNSPRVFGPSKWGNGSIPSNPQLVRCQTSHWWPWALVLQKSCWASLSCDWAADWDVSQSYDWKYVCICMDNSHRTSKESHKSSRVFLYGSQCLQTIPQKRRLEWKWNQWNMCPKSLVVDGCMGWHYIVLKL